MAKNPETFLKRLLHDNQTRKRIRSALLVLSLFVITSVFWSLKLTGITMAGEAFCGKDEHIHGDDCPTGTLVCTLVEAEAHTHTEACILRELICLEQEREGHVHTEACEAKTLLCTEQTLEGHVHTSSCEIRTLVCEEEEVQGHAHAEACWDRNLTCTIPETEGHAHENGCWQTELICGLEEDENHTHEEGCAVVHLICENPEVPAHFHGEECYESILICTEEERPGHTHTEECFVLEEGYSCGIHVHTPECYSEETVYICGQEASSGHTHEDACYRIGIGFGCGLTEAEGHVHTQECITEETEIDCGREASEGHVHGEACYETYEQCPLEEHIHDESCYSNIDADLETEEDWLQSMAGIMRSSVTAEDVAAIAHSQLGCRESTLNFQVDAHGVRRGITRYGQWYGNPYGDWSAMFVSFCLHYAGVEDVAFNAGPEAMRQEWEKAGLYVPAADFSPRMGDLLFVHMEKTEEETGEEVSLEPAEENLPQESEKLPANAVAIITGFDGEYITVIQGDLDNVVAETTYPADDPAVLGYGKLPENPSMVVLVEPPVGAMPIAAAVNYNTNLFNADNQLILYTTANGRDYAIDGSGNAVEIYVNNGEIYTDLEDTAAILWSFTSQEGSYLIQNVQTGRYLHAFANNGGGVVTTGAYTSQVSDSNGLLVRSNNEYARLDLSQNKFVVTRNEGEAVRYKIGNSYLQTIWLDGTGGWKNGSGQNQLGGSENKSFFAVNGGYFTLPDSWKSPEKYEQKLRGWYDVTNSIYYAPGARVPVNGDMVFYADWTAATYDIGRYNSQTVNTVSTNAFITTHLFDYNYLFNVMSANPTVTVNASGHSEDWRMVQSGNVEYNNQQSLGFVFVDYDGSSRLPDMSNRNGDNNYHGVGIITEGIYSPTLGSVLFDTDNALDPQTGEGIIGKTYVGTADYMFQYMDDPEDPYYGYYFYDSHRNAASYNRSDGRFYIYDYLEATSDSVNSDNRSDFLPFNSPYANTNGKTVRTYTDPGESGEYNGVDHYRYDSKYSDNNNGTGYVSTNYAFGMKMEVQFYLPNVPGSRDENGEYGNKDLYGRDMHFRFEGDDDVWVLVDGVMVDGERKDDVLVLDVGGIHGVEGGDINFSTGTVTVNGQVHEELSAVLKSLVEGEHKLTFMYLERGSSQSNCAFFFNLAPRFSLTLQKEDVLTQELLNGAQFSFYRDRACQVPAQLWENEAAHDSGIPATNVFTVKNGVANVWGLASGNTYYIKETKPPDAEGYGFANGLIRLTIDKDGIASYDVEILDDGDGVSNGFTVHGIKIDEETQSAYIVATNAPEWVKDITTVQTMKQWNDSKDHSGEYVTAYLTVTDPDGTVRRIREVILSDENDWMYTWTNLPKYASDGVTPIQYGIQEAYVPGYQAQIQPVDEFRIVKETWAEALELHNGQTYIFRYNDGYLSTTGAGADTGYKWVDEDTAKSSPYAQWTAHASGSNFKLTNRANQTITFYYGGGSPTDFYASTGGESDNAKQYFRVRDESSGIRLYYRYSSTRNYYMTSSMNSAGKFGYSTSRNSGMILVPMTLIQTTHTQAVTGLGFQINNSPLTDETSVEVLKRWENAYGDNPLLYQTSQVTIRLLANGVDTGRTVTLNLKNGWRDTFQGLPARDAQGNLIVYTVEENWDTDDWIPSYGEVISSGGQNPIYTTTVTNTYRRSGPMLPSTGTAARRNYILCGAGIMLLSLVYGFVDRRKRERRRK